jgi:hypothetical protein
MRPVNYEKNFLPVSKLYMNKEEIKMYESRCGVCCNSCERKENGSCKGCLHMDKPFWGGVCKVKSCCEEKGLNFCGKCGEFPCEMLSNMGKEQGFDPTVKIEQCRKWLKELEQEQKNF